MNLFKYIFSHHLNIEFMRRCISIIEKQNYKLVITLTTLYYTRYTAKCFLGYRCG